MGFRRPDFKSGEIELRNENNEISIYATTEGLKKIKEICEVLIKKDKEEHIHLEDYEILTKESMIGAIALFRKAG